MSHLHYLFFYHKESGEAGEKYIYDVIDLVTFQQFSRRTEGALLLTYYFILSKNYRTTIVLLGTGN